MSEVYIVGVAATPFGPAPDLPIVELARRAGSAAIRDAEIPKGRIGAGYFANVLGGPLFGDTTMGQNVFAALGIFGPPIVNVENACTAGSSAFYLATHAIAAGACDVALVVGAEKMCVPSLGLVGGGQSDYASRNGMAAPVGFAMRAHRHMLEYGTTERQLAAVTVKSRAFGAMNPLAQFRQPETIDNVLSAPMIADPLTRSQCCPIADGAAACVLAGASAAKSHRRAVRVDAAVLTSGLGEARPDIANWRTDYETCRLAYEQAGVGPEDLDVAECHDAFTISEILHYEALGLCPPGAGGAFVESGAPGPGGATPVNPSGGLLSRGHPVAATGLAQIAEIVAHLREEAGARQTPGARVGVAHCMGGDMDGDTKSCTAVVMSK